MFLKMKKGGIELGVKSSVMIKEIDGLQYLYTKDAKAVVTEEKKTMLCLYVTYSQDKTFEKIRNKYYWKGMFKDVCNFVKLCSMQRASVYQHKLIYNLLSYLLEKG